MPVSPATVRNTYAEVVPGDVPAPAAADVAEGDGESRAPSQSVKRRVLIAAACVSAFVVGFAGMTVLMRDTGSASKPRPKTPQTSAPQAGAGAPVTPQTSTRAPASAPPSSALVAEQGGGAPAAPSQPPSPSMPRTESGGAPSPSPSTSAPAPTTAPPTTAPPTTTP